MNDNSLKNDSISSLIAKFSAPAIIGMVVNAIYNIVDRIFIGRYVGEDALASLVVVFPIMLFIFALSVLSGQGGANLMSISLGKGDKKGADKYFTVTILLTLILSVVTSALVYLFLRKILVLFGANEEVLEYSKTYLGIYLCFAPISVLSFALSTSVRAEGFPKLAMFSMILSAITNIVLDYIFIGLFGMGVAGGAIATGIGQTVGFLILAYHYVAKKSVLKFKKKYMTFDFKSIKEICTVGFPSFLSTFGVSVAMFVSNKALGTYGGVAAVTAMAAINSLFTMIIMPINGIQGGIQPIIGYNHGAKLRSRVKETLIKGTAVAMIFSLIAFVIIQSQPVFLLSFFIDGKSSTMEVAVIGLKLFMLSLPFLAINIISIGYFQAIQKPNTAIILGLLRQFVLLIPLVLILPKYLGLLGVWIAIPISDFIAIIVSAVLLWFDLKSKPEPIFEMELNLEKI